MSCYGFAPVEDFREHLSLSHLTDHVLLRDLSALVARDRTTTAALLAHLAEVDARRLYVPAGYPSMYLYCVRELHLSEEAAYKRIHAARTARRVPAVFALLADGRLHLSAVILLAPYLAPENANELLATAAHKTKSEIEHNPRGWLSDTPRSVLSQPLSHRPHQQLRCPRRRERG